MAEDLNIVMKAGDILKKSDFETAFKQVLVLIEKILAKHEQAIADFKNRHMGSIADIQNTTNSSLSDLKKQTNQLFVEKRLGEMSAEQSEMFGNYQKEMTMMMDKMMTEAHGEIRKRAVKGDRGEPGLQGLPPTKEEIQVMLQPIIDEFKDEVKEIMRKMKPVPTKLGMRKVPIIKRINLTSQVDGNTRAFTLPRDTVEILGVFGTQFPITFDSADWTFAGQTLTLASGITTPESGQTLFVLVEVLFY